MENRHIKRHSEEWKVNDWQGKKKGNIQYADYLVNLGIEKQTEWKSVCDDLLFTRNEEGRLETTPNMVLPVVLFIVSSLQLAEIVKTF